MALAMAGCGSTPQVSTSTTPSAPPVSREQLSGWREFRAWWALRTDDAWMLEVAAMPRTSANEFKVPLTDAEMADIGGAVVALDGVVEALTRYGEAHPETYAGVIVEGPLAILLVSGPVQDARTELEALLPGTTDYEVRWTPHARRDFEAFADRVREDEDWFTAEGLELIEAHVGAEGVQIRFRGGAGNEVDAVARRYGSEDWVEVRWEGPSDWEGRVGTIRVVVRDRLGQPVSTASCEADPLDPLIPYDVAVDIGTNEAGVCLLRNVPAVEVRVKVFAQGQSSKDEPQAKRRVLVAADGVVTVRVAIKG